jgi:hypothetical protein
MRRLVEIAQHFGPLLVGLAWFIGILLILTGCSSEPTGPQDRPSLDYGSCASAVAPVRLGYGHPSAVTQPQPRQVLWRYAPIEHGRPSRFAGYIWFDGSSLVRCTVSIAEY